MLDVIINKPVERGSGDFLVLEKFAKIKLSELHARNSGSLLSHLTAHMRYSMLNTQLSFHGWAIKRDGKMFPVRLRGETQNPQQITKSECLSGSAEAYRDQARRTYVQTGKVIDPKSGRELPPNEKHRFGII